LIESGFQEKLCDMTQSIGEITQFFRAERLKVLSLFSICGIAPFLLNFVLIFVTMLVNLILLILIVFCLLSAISF